jgi:hypothetical protein
VARVSLGSAIAQAAYALAARAAAELIAQGTYDATADAIPYDRMNAAIGSVGDRTARATTLA